jgi:FkbM family methyltransferase
MYLDTRDIMITPGILCWGGWEPETTSTLERVLKPGMSWADIGANVGYFTIIGHRLVRGGGGKTFAFEANPAAFDFLSDNVRLNWFFDSVICEQKAIYSETTTVRFGAPTKYAVNASIAEHSASEWKGINDSLTVMDVEAVSIDDYFAGSKLDFLKVDVEGAEPFVLRGAQEFLRKNKEVALLIEWSPNQLRKCGSSPEELATLINSFGFRIWRAEGDRRAMTPESLLDIVDTTMIILSRSDHFAHP